jgi:hypothetical protein
MKEPLDNIVEENSQFGIGLLRAAGDRRLK